MLKPTSERKTALRASMRTLRDQVSPQERALRSSQACAALQELPEFARARVVTGFIASRSEADPSAALAASRAAGTVVALPRVSVGASPRLRFHVVPALEALRPGAYGILEPDPRAPEVSIASIDVVVMPGLAFDARGARLGYGGGYFDEFGAHLGDSRRCTLVGFGFALQVVDECPADDRDVLVDVVVTDRGAIRCGGVRSAP